MERECHLNSFGSPRSQRHWSTPTPCAVSWAGPLRISLAMIAGNFVNRRVPIDNTTAATRPRQAPLLGPFLYRDPALFCLLPTVRAGYRRTESDNRIRTEKSRAALGDVIGGGRGFRSPAERGARASGRPAPQGRGPPRPPQPLGPSARSGVRRQGAPAPGRFGTARRSTRAGRHNFRVRRSRAEACRAQWSGCRCRRRAAGRRPSGPPPKIPMTQAPIGCVMQASRVETSGWKRLRRLASKMRAATWAGPIIMPANTACAGVAPNASTIRGRCAAMAEVTVQAAANANDSSTIVRSIGMCGLTRALRGR